MMNKRGIEMSFAWLFAIIAGAVIIFLAIYATIQLVGSEKNVQNTEVGKQLGILLNPIETSLESAKFATIKLNSETRLYNICSSAGTFGTQGISAAVKSGVGEQWPNLPGTESSFYNKYIFSEDIVQGTEYYIFVKPFEFPFKIADLSFIWPDSEEYCFVDTPREIESEVEDLQLKNVQISSDIKNCTPSSKKVCFASSGCDIDVSLTSKSVKKQDKTIFYEGDLIYGAIFSSPDVYECQIKRLMKRVSEIALLNVAKTQYLSVKGCNANLESDLAKFASMAQAMNSSLDLRGLASDANNLEGRDSLLSCKMW